MSIKSSVLLSFYIPTYNRANCLKELLDSLIINIGNRKDIEIVISDNAFPDSTGILVQEYLKKYDYILYHRQETNYGFDRNMQKVALLASGEYIWFFGDDDRLEQNALGYILPILEKREQAMFLVNAIGYSYDWSKRNSEPTYKINKDMHFASYFHSYTLVCIYIS